MWASGPTLDFNPSLTLVGFSTGQLGFTALDGDLSVSASFGAALVANLNASAGGVNLDYPVNAGFSLPNLVAPGQQFTVNTAANGLNTASPAFTADFPQIGASLDLVTTGGFNASFDSWLLGSFAINADFGSDTPLVSLSSGQSKSFLDGHLILTVPTDYNQSSVNVSGTTGLPDVTFAGSTPSFVAGGVDLFDVLSHIIAPESPENIFSGSYLDGKFQYTIASALLTAGIGIAQQFQFVPTGISAEISTPWGQTDDVKLGQSATFTVPDSWTGPVDLTTQYVLSGNLVSQTGILGNLDFNFSLLSGQLGPISFGPLFSQDFPLFSTAPLYLVNPGGPNGFALQGFNTPTGDISIGLGTGLVTLPGSATIDTTAFTANSTALIQTVLTAAAGSATQTNIYDPTTPSGSATAVGGQLNVEVIDPSGVHVLPAGFQAGILEPGGSPAEIDSNGTDSLLAAAAGTGNTDTIKGGLSDTLVGGQDGNVDFIITSAFTGEIAGLAQGDVIDVTNVAFDSSGSAKIGVGSANVLFLDEGGNSHTIQLSPVEDYSGTAFKIGSDGATGTDITVVTPPPPPAAPTLDPASDSNIVGDKITNINTPKIDGTGTAGNVVTLHDGGAVLGTETIPGSGDWSITTGTLSDGVHDLTTTVTDGNNITGAASTPLALTIDTTPPPAPSTLALDPSTDDGAKGDNITSITAPKIDGSGEAGDTVKLFDGATTLGTGTVAQNGTWSIVSSALAPGAHALTASETDVAGNASGASSPLNITIAPPAIGPTGANQPFFFGSTGQYVVGTTGADVVWGNSDNSTVSGLGGNDVLGAGGNNNLLDGGDGNDTVVGIGNGDTLNGGDGNDTVVGLGNGDTIAGGNGDDLLVGLGSSGSFDGGTGNDTIWAFGNHETVQGGAGDDMVGIVGTGGTIDGGADDDTIFAFGGGNTVTGGDNSNTLYLSGGNNIFEDTTGRYHDTVWGFDQAAGDRIHLTTDTPSNAVANATQSNFGFDTVITLSDGSTIVLKFVNNFGSGFFA